MTRFAISRPILVFLCGLLLALQTACSSFPPPTETEVKKTIETFFTEVYGKNNGGAVYKGIQIDFGAVAVGKIMEGQMGLGGKDRQVYPVKVPIKIAVSYSNNPTISVYKRGETTDDVFFFYKDGFDKWTFRTGRM